MSEHDDQSRAEFEAAMRAHIKAHPEHWIFLEGQGYEPEAAFTGWKLARATLSPAHIEDGEEVEVVGYRHVALNVKSMSAVCQQDHPPVIPMVEWSAPEPLMTVAQHQRIKDALSADNQRVVPPEPILAAPHPMAALSAPPAGVLEGMWSLIEATVRGAFSDGAKDYRGCMQERLRELKDALAAPAPPAAGVPDGYVIVPAELIEHVKHARKMLGGDPEPEYVRARLRQKLTDLLATPTPPASEQQRAVGLDVIDRLRLELLPEYEAGYTAVAYGDSDQPVARADGMTAREAIAELLRLNPHLAKGEGV